MKFITNIYFLQCISIVYASFVSAGGYNIKLDPTELQQIFQQVMDEMASDFNIAF